MPVTRYADHIGQPLFGHHPLSGRGCSVAPHPNGARRLSVQAPSSKEHNCRCHRLVARVAALELDTERAADEILATSVAFTPGQQEQDTLDWERQWYPLAFLEYLDPKVPHPVELLGQRLVLWRDAQQRWRCFEDKCPHRLAPLSEGRIEPSDGTLMCSYHGWRFNGEGKCTDVPQSIDAKANAAACASPRSCVNARPVKVHQGMIFVWGSSSPHAALESEAKPVPGMPEMEQSEETPRLTIDGRRTFTTLPPYFRQLPYGWEVLAENLSDPSHLPYAHSGVLNSRTDENAGYFRMSAALPEGPPFPGLIKGPDTIAVSGASIRPVIRGIHKRLFQLDPPARIRWGTLFDEPAASGDAWMNMLTFYVIPNGPQRSSVLFQGFFSEAAASKIPLGVRLIQRLQPKWWRHCFAHNVFDGDSKILYMQERILSQTPNSWRQSYYMPAQADRLVAAFRKWLDTRGGGGPPTRLQPGAALPPVAERQEAFLDRHDTHTRHCPYCSGAMQGFQRLQVAAAAVSTLCLLGLSAVLGRGAAPTSAAPLGLVAGALAGMVAWYVSAQVLRRLTFLGYNHSEK